jgi:hypothetical protein
VGSKDDVCITLLWGGQKDDASRGGQKDNASIRVVVLTSCGS